jgi:hypothetical protein
LAEAEQQEDEGTNTPNQASDHSHSKGITAMSNRNRPAVESTAPSGTANDPLQRASDLANDLLAAGQNIAETSGDVEQGQRALAVQADTTDNPILRMLDATLKQVFSLALFVTPRTATDFKEVLGRKNATETLRMISSKSDGEVRPGDMSLEALWQPLVPGRYIEPQSRERKRGHKIQLTPQGKQIVEEMALPILVALTSIKKRYYRKQREIIVGSTTFLSQVALRNFKTVSEALAKKQRSAAGSFKPTHRFIKTERTFECVDRYEVDLCYGGYTPRPTTDVFVLPDQSRVTLGESNAKLGGSSNQLRKIEDPNELKGAKLDSENFFPSLDIYVVSANRVGLCFAKSQRDAGTYPLKADLGFLGPSNEIRSLEDLAKCKNGEAERILILPSRGVIFQMICAQLGVESQESTEQKQRNVEEKLKGIGWTVGSWAEDVHVAESTFLAYAEHASSPGALYAMVILEDIYNLRNMAKFTVIGPDSKPEPAKISHTFIPFAAFGTNEQISNVTLTVCAMRRKNGHFFDESRLGFSDFMESVRHATSIQGEHDQ